MYGSPTLRRRGRLRLLLVLLSAAAVPDPGVTRPCDSAQHPARSTAQAELNALTVASQGSMYGYSRDLFPHWIAVAGTCNTRETVLKRDGANVLVDGSCYPTSGSWATSRRQAFANDPAYPQLIAVTDDVNQAKGDQDPSTWQPPRSAYRCTYSKIWIRVKYHWNLTLQSSEKSALHTMLNSC